MKAPNKDRVMRIKLEGEAIRMYESIHAVEVGDRFSVTVHDGVKQHTISCSKQGSSQLEEIAHNVFIENIRTAFKAYKERLVKILDGERV